jgi:DNA-directed RNA polymerase subunit RPC12/RpoP
MQLPESTVVPDLLNGPCPPTFPHSVIATFGDGVDSINVRCSRTDKVIDFHIPSRTEVLEEYVREHGFDIVHDEKRSSYIPTIRRFGGLHQAAMALTGQAGQIIEVVRAKTLRQDQIRGKCKLGKGDLSDRHYFDRIDQMLANESERMKRIGRKRYEHYARGRVPEKMKLGAFLEHWADKAVLLRSWEIGPCVRCKQTSFVAKLDLRRPLLCPNCGSRMLLPEEIPIGYSLARSIRHSINEGIGPVVLAGRFLRNLTSRGFFWLPGIKYRKGDDLGDIDLLACCDGHIVMGECKSMPKNAKLWGEIAQQFLDLASVAIECRASVVLFATQVTEIPEQFTERVAAELDGRIPFILLNAEDLEKGHRRVDRGGSGSFLGLHDLIPTKFPDRAVANNSGPRHIKLGWGIFTKNG